MVKAFFFFLTLFIITRSSAQLAIAGDYADPTIIKVNGTYYSAGTSSEWAPHFPIFTSNDLQTWHHAGYAFKEKPKWTLSSFWAPELFYRNGLFYLYYTAKRASDSISCLGVATSTDPAKGFTDHGVLLAHGKEAIDAFVIEDENKLFVTYKAYGLDQRPIELLGAELSNDGLKVIGEPFSLLQDTARTGLEGQCIIKNNGYFYLFYSVGGCCGIDCSYAIEVARSKSFKGPYVKSPNNPFLSETQNWKCPGHGTIVNAGKNDWYYMFHAYNKKDDVFTGRQGLLGKMEWEGEWPRLIPGTNVLQAITKKVSDFQWQWDFRHGIAKINSKEENICFEAEADNNPTGTVLTIRPTSGNYSFEAKVQAADESLKGLTIYGDATASLGIGIRNQAIEVWQVKDGQRVIIKNQKIKIKDSVVLKIVLINNDNVDLGYVNASNNFQAISHLKSTYLPQWDRSPRPGLHYSGKSKGTACFSSFAISYQ